jgi:glycosyltransferase involved in cell wall biosynthesis
MGYNVTILAERNDWNSKVEIIDGVKLTTVGKGPSFPHLPHIRLLCHILRNTQGIDCLILFFAGVENAIISMLFKLIRRNGICIVKMDSDGRLYGTVLRRNLIWRAPNRFVGELKLRSLSAFAFRLLSAFADLLTIESPEARERVLSAHPWLKHKLIVLPNGINQKRFDELSQSISLSREKKILFVGRVEGVDLLIRAFSRLKDRYPDWSVELVGEVIPSFNNEIEKLIPEQLKARVILTGPLYGEDLLGRYLSAKIFCLPSRREAYSFIGVDYSNPKAKPFLWRENFPIVLVEAMYCNNAIVCSDVGAARYILGYGNAGLIFEAEDVDQLSACLDKLMADEVLRNRLAAAGKSRCEELFNWETIVGELGRYISGTPQSRTPSVSSNSP